MVSRGVFVVLEGVDRSGKSTQCKLLVESLRAKGRDAELVRFPERSTPLGAIIDRYLKREIELDDHAVHLLFSANRWELATTLRNMLAQGTDVVCDRYAYSGVAFSAAKDAIDDIEWCKAPDKGLPEPDAVLYLVLDRDAAQARQGYGGERYEESDMQQRVAHNFEALKSDRWHVVDAARDVDAVRADIDDIVQGLIDSHPSDISDLW